MNAYAQAIEMAKQGIKIDEDNLLVLPTTTSTMNWVTRAIRSGRQEELTVIALTQTKGQASGNFKKWESGDGNFFMSRLLWIEPHEFGQEIEMIAACAAAEIIQSLLPQAAVTLKYPNDVRVDEEKICGCLVPPRYDRRKLVGQKRAINLGVGINVAIAPVTTQATTCLSQHGRVIELADLMDRFDKKMTELLAQYRSEKNFNVMLDRMGFTNDRGQLSLRTGDGKILAAGMYSGFENIGGTMYMVLADGRQFALRGFHLSNGSIRRDRTIRLLDADTAAPDV